MKYLFPLNIDKDKLKEVSFKSWQYNKIKNSALHFSIEVPESFKLLKSFDVLPSVQAPVIDCAYFKEERMQMEVIIECSYLPTEIYLSHYYEQLSKSAGEELIEQRFLMDDLDKPDMLTSRKFKDGETWITRRTGYKIFIGDGAYVLTLNIAANITVYNDLADLVYAIFSSFTLANKPAYALAERLRLFSRKDPGDFATYIPFSWVELHHHNNTLKKFNAVFTKKLRNKVIGMLNISTLAKSEAKTEEEALTVFHSGYEKQGIKAHAIKTSASKEIPCFKTVQKGTGVFKNPEGENELTFYIAEHKKCWFYLELFGPAKSNNFEAWAVNTRALNLVASHFSVA